MNRRRLTVEQWRDAVLFVAGQLGPGGGKSMELDDPTNLRRTVYARVSRLKLNDLLMQFDYPGRQRPRGEARRSTNTPMQKLFVLNSPFMIEQAQGACGAARREGAADDAARVAARLPAAVRPRAGRRTS